MFPPGHIGLSLLLYAPVAYLLVVRGREKDALTALPVVVVATLLPDVDVLLNGVPHRGVTHSLSAAVVVGVGCAVYGWVRGRVGSRRECATLWGVLGCAGVVSHILGDAITPWGVRPFQPVSAELYTLALVRSADPLANVAMFFVGLLAFRGTLRWAEVQSGVARVDEPPVVEAGKAD